MYDPHPSLTPLKAIEAGDGYNCAFVFPSKYAEISVLHGRTRASAFARRFTEYVELSIRIWKKARYNHIVVREFSTFYFILTLLLCLPLRRKISLIVAHNVQAAVTSRLQRALLRFYHGLGVKMICLESADLLSRWLGSSKSLITIRHPVTPLIDKPRDNAPEEHGTLRVGFVGDLRPEKGIVGALECVLEAPHDKSVQVFIGTPKPSVVEEKSWDVKILSTKSKEQYFQFLSSMHVLIVPYPSTTYAYRASGIVADACSVGTPVICPHLPILERQVLDPGRGGICLHEDQLLNTTAVADAIADLRRGWTLYAAGMYDNAREREIERVMMGLSDSLKAS